MHLFKTYEYEITTNRTKDSVIKDLSDQAIFKNDEFTIPSKMLSFRRGTKVKGIIFTNGKKTTVKVRILPTAEVKAFASIWFGLLLIFFVVFLIEQFKEEQLSLWNLVFPAFGLFGYLILKLNNWISVELQKRLIEELVR